MDTIIPLFILIFIFVRGIVRYISDNPWNPLHRCNNHQLYFEDHASRGTYCAVCGKTIDEEFFIPKK